MSILTTVALWTLAGSGVAAIGPSPAVIDPTMPGVVFEATRARFADQGRLVIAGSPVYSPGTRDFAISVTVQTKPGSTSIPAGDHANVFQHWTSRPGGVMAKIELATAKNGPGKADDVMNVPRCELQADPLPDGTPSDQIILVAPKTSDNAGPLTIRCVKNKSNVQLFVNGVMVARRGVTLGAFTLDRDWSIGAKLGANVTPSDALAGWAWNARVEIKP